MPILVTGAAGFIGSHACRALLDAGHEVVGVDSLAPFTPAELQQARLARLRGAPGFGFIQLDLADPRDTADLFDAVRPDAVLHLAAQAGVRHSVDHPEPYVSANLAAFVAVLEGCRHTSVGHLVYASSSSVYGQQQLPLREDATADRPRSLYAATKRADELMAHAWSHLHGMPTSGVRLFTVYGPWGRPDMAPTRFARALVAGEPVQLYNRGRMLRDFTYVVDAVRGLLGVLARPPGGEVPWRLVNVASGRPVELERFVDALAVALGRTAERRYLPLQPGDVVETHADVTALRELLGGWEPWSLEDGVGAFADWYLDYHGEAGESGPAAG